MLDDNKRRPEEMLEEQKEGEPLKEHFSFPWLPFVIVVGAILTLMAVCVIVILLNGGFYQW